MESAKENEEGRRQKEETGIPQEYGGPRLMYWSVRLP
jgi:hypothetical protein